MCGMWCWLLMRWAVDSERKGQLRLAGAVDGLKTWTLDDERDRWVRRLAIIIVGVDWGRQAHGMRSQKHMRTQGRTHSCYYCWMGEDMDTGYGEKQKGEAHARSNSCYYYEYRYYYEQFQ